jgi:hypothetical protein
LKFKKLYKRLGSAGHLFYRYTLWLGHDHLLYISIGIFVEEYSRFYFRDVQSVIIHKTNSWNLWNIVLGCLAALFLIMTVSSADIERIVFGIMAGLVIVILVINYVRGPTCACYIQTAVQRKKLHSINRMKKARLIMDTLKLLVLQSQRGGNYT